MAQTDNTVVVRGGPQGFAQQVTAGRHHLTVDEPESSGGTDRGPGPYDLLLAALGS
jgi:putative redox protein